MSNRDFKGVWIPKEIWLNEDLSITEKCLLVEIDSLDNDTEKGCFASNEYLGKFIGISAGRAANIISDLKKRNFLNQVFFDGRNRGLRLHENVKNLHENVKADPTKTLKHTSRKREHINTGINTDSNNSLSLREREETISPSTEESTWVSNSETRYQKALSEITAYLKENPTRWGEIANEGRAKLDKAAFFAEVKAWLRWNADNWPVIQFPVKALTSGKSNFIGWLAGSKEKRSAPRAPAQVEGPNYRIHKRQER